MTSPAIRSVTRTIRGQATSDGAGVRLRRVIGGAELPDLDPFLLFDEFGSDAPQDYIAGFPDHPHRGFETVTYMLDGRMRHRDNQGNSGLLGPGSVQWMTAGRGIVHSEMPEQSDGLMRGFQLWVNLPARDKMTAPRYQDIPPEQVPEVRLEPGALVRVLAGSFGGIEGAVHGIAIEPSYFDVHLQAAARISVPLPETHSAFAYVYAGTALIGHSSRATQRGELAVLGPGATFLAQAEAQPTRLLLVAGRALKEPIARHGPFVMNTREEILRAFEDYNAGRF